ncbi:MAG: hypothetical protein IIZ49_01530, partial [Oscillospiraceae bacterium]|nr:hypothetical protein [Oscillospiraceae bacterium]
ILRCAQNDTITKRLSVHVILSAAKNLVSADSTDVVFGSVYVPDRRAGGLPPPKPLSLTVFLRFFRAGCQIGALGVQ